MEIFQNFAQIFFHLTNRTTDLWFSISRCPPRSSIQLNRISQMSTDFADRAPLLRDPQPLQAVRHGQSDQWAMMSTAIASVFVLFLLGAFILIACYRFANTTASPPSAWQHNQHAPPPPAVAAVCPETVAALPLVWAGAGQKFYRCAVCLIEYEERERVKLMPGCGHVFHPKCIDKWLLSQGSCPICRCSDLSGWKTGELRLDVIELEGEGGEEENLSGSHRMVGKRRSCSSSVEVEGTNISMVFLQRSCSSWSEEKNDLGSAALEPEPSDKGGLDSE